MKKCEPLLDIPGSRLTFPECLPLFLKRTSES